MLGTFISIVFWVSFIGSIALLGIGVARLFPRLLVVGSFVSLPFALVMALYPWGPFTLLVPVGHALAAYSFRPSRVYLRIAAVILVAFPTVVFVLTLFVAPIPSR